MTSRPRIINFGSLNIDHVYSVPHIVRPGETLSSIHMEKFAGGKGLNQSIALAKAGVGVQHAGNCGPDGAFLIDELERNKVDTSLVKHVTIPSGQAIIQVASSGQNSIVLYQGANYEVTTEQVSEVVDSLRIGDYLLLQNEINAIETIIDAAYEKGAKIVFNPSPMTDEILSYDLHKITCFLLNEIEAAHLAEQAEYDETTIHRLKERYPEATILLTLGEDGSICYYQGQIYEQAAYPVQVVDTTGAGDTFTGYFLATLMQGAGVQQALEKASLASAIAVSRQGAAKSIPLLEEVEEKLKSTK